MVLCDSNTYTGGTTINGGTLAVSSLGTLGATSGSLALGGGVLDLGGGSQTVGAVSITAVPTGGNTIQNGTLTANSYTVSNPGGTVAVTADLRGTGATLTMSGAGTLILSGTNSYDGGTFVEAGTLILASPAALQDGTSLTVGAGGTFFLDPSATAGHDVSLVTPAVSPVPEPGTLAMLIAGLGVGFGVWQMRKRI